MVRLLCELVQLQLVSLMRLKETGEVVKVMLDDFAKKEYDLCQIFSQAGLAPAPLSLDGPCSVPGGDLYCIRMEAISHTLHGLLSATKLNWSSRVVGSIPEIAILASGMRQTPHGGVYTTSRLEKYLM